VVSPTTFLETIHIGVLSVTVTAIAWAFEFTTILAGYLWTIQLDAHSLVLSVDEFLFFSFPFSVGITASIRAGNLIGNGKAIDAQRAGVVSFCLSVCLEAILIWLVLLSKEPLAHKFSSDPDVADLVAIHTVRYCTNLVHTHDERSLSNNDFGILTRSGSTKAATTLQYPRVLGSFDAGRFHFGLCD
jgi:Na+-driven multidrug efflux pump